jgi:putative transposase
MEELQLVSRQAHERRIADGRVRELKPHAMGGLCHVVFISKRRRRKLYVELRKYLGEVFRRWTEQMESRVEEGYLMLDDVHMMLCIPPKYAVLQVVGFIKGKSAMHLARVYGEYKRNFAGQSFWARGYFVSTVSRDEQAIRAYIRNQEAEDRWLEQLQLLR